MCFEEVLLTVMMMYAVTNISPQGVNLHLITVDNSNCLQNPTSYMDDLLNSNYTLVIATLSASTQRPVNDVWPHRCTRTHLRTRQKKVDIVDVRRIQRGSINLVIKNQHAC